jgi:hypothetical protein
MWFWPVNGMIELVSGMPAPQYGDESSCEDQSRFKVQAVPMFRFDWRKILSLTLGGTRTPGWRPLAWNMSDDVFPPVLNQLRTMPWRRMGEWMYRSSWTEWSASVKTCRQLQRSGCTSLNRNTVQYSPAVWQVGFEVLTAVVMDVATFWDIAQCSPHVNRRFGRTYHFHLQGLKSTE